MITRKDNILKKPYEEKRFNDHRRKVKSAACVIDNKPPISRFHVLIKKKKQLKEIERIDAIQNNNFLLLQKLKDIRKTCRVDHYWTTPPPCLSNKVALYDTYILRLDKLRDQINDENDNEIAEIEERLEKLGIRKSKCNACSPSKQIPFEIPEERVPWDPPKLYPNRLRSKSLPPKKPDESSNIRLIKSSQGKIELEKKLTENKKHLNSNKKIELRRGAFRLDVNFPQDTTVCFQNGKTKKVVSGGSCSCKAIES